MPRRLTVYAPLLKLAVAMSLGIVIGDCWGQDETLWMAVLAATVGVTLLLGRWPKVQSLMIVVCFVVLGVLLAVRQRSKFNASWPNGAFTYEAVVASQPVEKAKTVAVDLLMTRDGRRLKAYLYKDIRSRRLRIGDGLVVRSAVQPNSDWRTGSFSYRRYLEVNGFTGNTFVKSRQWQWRRVSMAGLSRMERARLRFLVWRSHLLSRYRRAGLNNDQYAVVAAMTLGDKSALTRELKTAYSISGASHVLALSGLHLGIIFGLFSLLGNNRRWRTVVLLSAVIATWGFVLLVGMPPSVVRAAVMLSVYALLTLAGRNRTPVNILAFTAIVMLCVNPWSLFDVGFQLSFLAMLSILVITPVLQTVMPRQGLLEHRFVAWIWGLVCVSIAAQLGVAPLVAYYFGRFSTCFLLTNFIVIPAATIVLYLSVTVLIVPSAGMLLAYVVNLLNTALTWVAKLPFASIEGLQPSGVQTVAAYVAIVALCLAVGRLLGIRASS